MSLNLKINDRFVNRKVEFFDSFTFQLKFNSISSPFGFQFYFDPFRVEHKELATVSHFHEVTLEHQPEGALKPLQVVKGLIVKNSFKQGATKSLTSFSGYALTGQLEDCTIPHSLYPLESNGLTLRQIAQRLISPFKLELIVDPAVASLVDSTFKKTTASATQTIKDYLTELAKQKDIILSHDEFGRLLMTKAKVNQTPIFRFDLEEGTPDGFSFTFEYDGQNMHRTITAQKQADIDGGNAGQSTVTNPYVIGSVFRPTTVSQTSGDDNDTVLAAKRARSNELRNIKLTIEIDKWDIDGELIRPNNTIEIIAPHLYIFRKEIFFIESVDYTGDHEKTTCKLNCVLPEVYNQQEPVNIFRGINIHPLDHGE